MRRNIETMRKNIAMPLSRVPSLLEKLDDDEIKQFQSLPPDEKRFLCNRLIATMLVVARDYLSKRKAQQAA